MNLGNKNILLFRTTYKEEIIMQVNEQLERKLSPERAKEILVEFCTEDSKLIEREQFLRAFEMLTTELWTESPGQLWVLNYLVCLFFYF